MGESIIKSNSVSFNKLSINKKIMLILFIIIPFSCMLAHYSLYYAFLIPQIEVYLSFLCSLLLFIIGQSLIEKRHSGQILFYFICGLLIICIPFIAHFESPYVSQIYQLCFACSFFLLQYKYRAYIYDKFIKIFAFILMLGIIEYFFAVLGFSIRFALVERPNVVNGQPYFYQSLFNLFPVYYDFSVFRFQSITEEPGLIGTLCSLIIISMDLKKYKKEFFFFFVSGIISLSLAFYVIIALWLLSMANKKQIKYFLITIVVSSCIYLVFERQIHQGVIDRINGREMGEIDNRTSDEFNKTFDSFLKTEEIYYGVGNRTFESKSLGSNAGVKKWIYIYGLPAMIILFFLYTWIYFVINGVSKRSIIIVILMWISFYQRPDWNLTTNIIILFSGTIAFVSDRRYTSKILKKAESVVK